MNVLFYLVLFLFLVLCVVLCFVILIQESKSMGLGTSFGGNSGDSLFGTSTAAVLKKFTAYLSGIFLITCLILSIWTSCIGRNKKGSLNVNIEEMSEKT